MEARVELGNGAELLATSRRGALRIMSYVPSLWRQGHRGLSSLTRGQGDLWA